MTTTQCLYRETGDYFRVLIGISLWGGEEVGAPDYPRTASSLVENTIRLTQGRLYLRSYVALFYCSWLKQESDIKVKTFYFSFHSHISKSPIDPQIAVWQ